MLLTRATALAFALIATACVRSSTPGDAAPTDTTPADTGLDALDEPVCAFQYDTPYAIAVSQCPPDRTDCQVCLSTVDRAGCPVTYAVGSDRRCPCPEVYTDPLRSGACDAGAAPTDAAMAPDANDPLRGFVHCPGAPGCNLATEVCCVHDTTGGSECSANCTFTYFAGCDGPEDCTDYAGGVCCDEIPTHCVPAELCGAASGRSRQVCHTDADCPAAEPFCCGPASAPLYDAHTCSAVDCAQACAATSCAPGSTCCPDTRACFGTGMPVGTCWQ